jgi:O-6-methylguanine DNA methyltransferase
MEIVHTAEFDSPVGTMRLASTECGLAYLALPRQSGRGFDGWLRRRAPDARCKEAFAPNRAAIAQIRDFLEGKLHTFDLTLDVRATPFQQSVYEALLAIPYGETRSYADVARSIGQPTAVRAVGSANGANPVPLVVPCHRVVQSGGKLGGYGGGVRLKKRLLAMERASAPGHLLSERPPG